VTKAMIQDKTHRYSNGSESLDTCIMLGTSHGGSGVEGRSCADASLLWETSLGGISSGLDGETAIGMARLSSHSFLATH
jgi:hypothetical protein